jgi:hypothetical protein
MSKSKLFLLAALALVALTAAAGSATAASFTISPGGAASAVSNGKVTFTAGETTIACNLTLSLELNRTAITKTAGNSVGSVTRVTWANCEGGEVAAVLNVPWAVTYQSISGTLPEGVTATGLQVTNAQFQLSVFGGFANCLYAGNQPASLGLSRISGATYRSGTLSITPTSLALRSGFGCPSSGTMRGTFTLTAQTVTRT